MESWSDSKLREECKSRGIKVGPITATTRNLYIRRITKHDESGPTVKMPAPSSSSTPVKVSKKPVEITHQISTIDSQSTEQVFTLKDYKYYSVVRFFRKAFYLGKIGTGTYYL